MTSIVIPLVKNGSRWGDKELRYALRSVEKHLTGYGDIFIIGYCPPWLQNVIHIPATDGDKIYEKERNIYSKILLACEDKRVSEDFLFMNDDHFLLQDFEAAKFPFYSYGFLSDYLHRVDPYQQTLQNTFDLIGDHLFFDIHCPILYKKSNFIAMNELSLVDWSKKWGCAIKTLYSYFLSSIDGLRTESFPDLKICDPLSSNKIKELITMRPWFSMDNHAREGGIETVLQELYPNKSKYEK